MASYDGATLKVTEIFSKTILLPMFVYGDCVFDFIHLSETGAAEIAKSTNLKHPHTFGHVVYVWWNDEIVLIHLSK